MITSAGLKVMVGAYCLRLLRQEGWNGAKVGAIAMVLATIVDSRTITGLRPSHPTRLTPVS